MSKRGKTEIRSFKVEELLEWARSGRLRLPAFQRKLRWEGRNVLDLFDSIYNAFPIGTLLLARRPLPPATVHFGPVHFPETKGADTHWIIDGQQRLTSIVGTLLHPDAEPKHEQFAVYFDLEDEKFFIRRKREVPLTAIPLRELGESTSVLGWLRKWPLAHERHDLESRVFELSKAIREFTVAAAIVEGDDTLLRSIFVRTNRAGVDMKEAEVFEALYGLTPRQSLAAAAARLSSGANGEIEANTLLRCAKHVAGMEPGARPEDLPEVDVQFIERTESALRTVLRFLSDDCELPHLELVQQRFILMPLSRYFSLFPRPSPRARRLLRRWVWRGLANGTFDDSGFGPIRVYQRTIAEGSEEAIAAEMLKLVGPEVRPVALPDSWNARTIETKFLAAALIRNLNDEDTETVLTRLNDPKKKGLADAGHFLHDRQVLEAWVPLDGEEHHTPAQGFSKEVRALLAAGHIDEALAARRTMLERITADFIAERCEVGASDRVSIRQLVGAA